MTARLALAIGCALALAGTAGAQSPFPDFAAKRVKPPEPGTGKRITVQIAPRPDPAVPPRPDRTPPPDAEAEPAPLLEAPDTGSGRHAWFWNAVSPHLADSAPGRLERALAALSAAPAGHGMVGPRLQTLRAIAEEHGTRLMRETVGTRVSPAFALAVLAVESGGRAEATSRAGARGLMQLMPETAASFGVRDSFDPDQNIAGGVAFLDRLIERYAADPILVLAGYNAGETAVAENAGVPPFAETRDYVPKVLDAFRTARALCLTPPELISDGCVFALR